jgi:hypothetical protein
MPNVFRAETAPWAIGKVAVFVPAGMVTVEGKVSVEPAVADVRFTVIELPAGAFVFMSTRPVIVDPSPPKAVAGTIPTRNGRGMSTFSFAVLLEPA